MTYDNNDGPVYSMLGGKVFSEFPCNPFDSNTGSCPGFCNTDVWIGTEGEVLAYCDEFASGIGGTCLGIVSQPNVDHPNRYLVFACV
jgi:hypothetical protein